MSPRRFLRLLIVLTAAAPFVFVPYFLFPAVVPRAAFFRLFVTASLVTALVWRSRASLRLRLRGDAETLALAAFVGVMVVAAVTSPVTGRSLLGTLNRLGGVVTWLFYLLFFLLLRFGLDDDGWRQLLRATALVSAAVALFALVQGYGTMLGIAVPGWKGRRVWSTVGNPGTLAAYLAASAAVAGHLWRTSSEVRLRAGWLCVVLIDVWAILLTGTRAVLVGGLFAAGLLGLFLFSLRRERHRRFRTAGVAGAAVVVLLTLLLAMSGALPGPDRLLALGPSALANRLTIWEAAWRGFLEYPLLGVGPENFNLLYDHNFEPSWYLTTAPHQDRAHNVILGTLAETGLGGLVAYGVFWGAVANVVVRLWRREGSVPWLAAGLVSYMVFLVFWFEDPVAFPVVLILVGYSIHRLRGAPREENGGTGEPRDRLYRWSGIALALAVSFVGLLHAFRSLAVARDLRIGSRRPPVAAVERFSGALEHELPSTREVTSRYVAAVDALVARARAGEPVPSTAEIRRIFEVGGRALDREVAWDSSNSVVRARRARLFAARFRWSGDERWFERAAVDLRRARDLSPGRLRHVHRLARLHAARGDTGRAMSLLRGARARLPEWGATWRVIAEIRWDSGSRDAAATLLHRAITSEKGGVGSDFLFRVGSWLERERKAAQAALLYEAWLGDRVPGWEEDGEDVPITIPGAGLPVAAHLPIVWLQLGRPEAALAAAKRLREGLPPHLRRPEVTDRLHRFIADLEAGRTERWRGEWGVLPTDVPLEG